MIDLSPLSGKSVLVTGATGLIGSNLVKALGAAGATVYFYSPQYEVDYVVHAAGYSSPAKFLAEPIKTIIANTDFLRGTLAYLRPGGSFLFLSSAEVYSGSPRQPHFEEDIGTTRPDHPRACYIEGKRCGEAIVNAYRAQGVNAKIARVALCYGPGTKPCDGRVLNQLIEQGLTKGRITLADRGSAVRLYCYIDDVVEMLLNILLHGKMPLYNVAGMGEPISILGLAQKIGAQLGVPVSVPRMADSKAKGAPQSVRLCINRYSGEFGKEDFVGLDEGLARTIEYQRGLYRDGTSDRIMDEYVAGHGDLMRRLADK